MTPHDEADGLRRDLAGALPCPGAAIAVLPVAGAAAAALPQAERDQGARFAFAKRRLEWIGGRLAAREALSDALSAAGRPAGTTSLTITTEPAGAPKVLQSGAPMGLGISIAHAGGMAAAVAFSTAHPIGLDFEPVTPLAPGLADLVLAQAERERHNIDIRDGVDPVVSLLRYWTAKEAAVKLTGTGFAVPFQHVLATPMAGDPNRFHVTFPRTAPARRSSCSVRAVATGRWVAALAWYPT